MNPTNPIDIVVPVYGARETALRCLDSVRRASVQSPWRLIIVDDAGLDRPDFEPELRAALRGLSRNDARIVLLENPRNVGFVASVNRGMAQAAGDVVLLNSDTEVAPGWLDRLRAAAHAAADIGTATPFSNNATICSYPRFCEEQPLPPGMTVADLDAICARVNAGRSVDIPTAVGFCMYIRRDCLDDVGLFDAERFGRGYGEENDFCMRARARGWRHVLAADCFVYHAGGASFSAEKSARVRVAQQTLTALHPHYEALVAAHIQADPARDLREAVERAARQSR
jgi:GT2 family glycosyltransferase